MNKDDNILKPCNGQKTIIKKAETPTTYIVTVSVPQQQEDGRIEYEEVEFSAKKAPDDTRFDACVQEAFQSGTVQNALRELGETFDYPQAKPATVPAKGAISLEWQEGGPLLRASPAVQERIEILLHKQQDGTLSEREQKELARYEEIDDYLSFLNRITRNL